MVQVSENRPQLPIDVRLDRIVEHLGGGIAVTDRDGTTRFVNPWLADRLGFVRRRISGRPLTDFLDEASRRQFNAALEAQRRGFRDPHRLTWRQSSGGSFPTIVFASPINDAEGNLLGSFTVVADIAEPKRIEEGLRIANLASQESSTVLYRARYGQDIPIEYVSPNLAQFGYTPEDFTSARIKFTDIVHGDDLDEVMANLARHTEAGTDGFVQRYRALTKRGETRWIEDHVFVLREAGRRAPLLHGFLTDITQQQISELSLRSALIQTIQAVSMTVDRRDPYTAGHQRRVALLSKAIGSEMRMDSSRLEGLYFGALIHDIGKIGVPIEILAKPSGLTGPEMGVVRAHVEIGADIVREVTFPWPIVEMIEAHHERLNGLGYPKGHSGKEIIAEARVLAVVRRHGTDREALWRALSDGPPASLLPASVPSSVDALRD